VNPGGRPKGLVRAIREQTDDGEHLVEFMLRVFRGEVDDASLRHRMEAATWLADRGFGKPIQALEHSGRDGEPLIPVDPGRQGAVDCDGDDRRPVCAATAPSVVGPPPN
jgi:hypothetical protein